MYITQDFLLAKDILAFNDSGSCLGHYIKVKRIDNSGELKNFDVDENEKGLFSIFKKGANKLTNLQARYSKVETNVETIAAELDKHQAILLKDIKMLDKMERLSVD